jgi:hypothetical protein
MCRRTGFRLTTALCQTPRLDPRTRKDGPFSTFHLVVTAWTVAPSGWRLHTTREASTPVTSAQSPHLRFGLTCARYLPNESPRETDIRCRDLGCGRACRLRCVDVVRRRFDRRTSLLDTSAIGSVLFLLRSCVLSDGPSLVANCGSELLRSRCRVH